MTLKGCGNLIPMVFCLVTEQDDGVKEHWGKNMRTSPPIPGTSVPFKTLSFFGPPLLHMENERSSQIINGTTKFLPSHQFQSIDNDWLKHCVKNDSEADFRQK